MPNLLNSLYQIVRHGQNTNSYKFALLRALARFAPQTDPSLAEVTTQQLAPIFVDLYWPLEVDYHLRQGIDPDKDPVLMVAMRKLSSEGRIKHGMPLADFKKQEPAAYANLVTLTERKAFDYVIACFHTVRGKSLSPVFFTHRATQGHSGGTMQLTTDAREFLISNSRLVEYVAVAGWTDFTETFSSSPKLFTKLSGEKPQRGSLLKWRPALAALQENRCFYCEGRELSKPQVDHVLPWSYVLEDRTWNLVLSCAECNGAKSNRLPPKYLIQKLVDRNGEVMRARVAGSAERFSRHFDEWRARDLNSHLKALYDQAVAEQFPVWSAFGPAGRPVGLVR